MDDLSARSIEELCGASSSLSIEHHQHWGVPTFATGGEGGEVKPNSTVRGVQYISLPVVAPVLVRVKEDLEGQRGGEL